MTTFTREDFEHAAKAAGLVVCGRLHPPDGVNIAAPHGPIYVWRPPVDDGDALRLAVKLRIKFRYNEVLGQALAWTGGVPDFEAQANIEDFGRDENAAARAAIFRAAIAIGRAMPAPEVRPTEAPCLPSTSETAPDQQVETLVTGGYAGDVLGIDGQWVPTITQVAIRYNGNIYAMPAPYRHHDVIRKIGGIAGPDTQGFLTNRGGFLTRTEAMQVAVTAGQLKRGPGGYQGPELFSEDLW